MTRTIRRPLTGAVALGVAGALSATAIAASSASDRDDDRDLKVVGLTSDQRLVRFDSDSPRRTRDIGDISGLTGDTSLVGIDHAMMDRVAIQSPANSGQLVPTGSLGMDAGPNVRADICSTVRSGVAVDNQALATVQVAGSHRLVEIEPLTGTARDQGAFPSRSQVTDIAIPLNQR